MSSVSLLVPSTRARDAMSRGQGPGHSRFVLSWKSLLLFCLGVLLSNSSELGGQPVQEDQVVWRGCQGFVGGPYDSGKCSIWKYSESESLAGGAVMLLCVLKRALGVNMVG